MTSNRVKSSGALVLAFGLLGFVSQAPAEAAACPGSSVQLSTLSPLAFSCTQGGFTFTLNSFGGFLGTDAISFSNPDASSLTYSLQGDVAWVTGTNRTLNYTIAAPSGKILNYYETAISSSTGNPKAGTYTASGSAGDATAILSNSTATNGSKVYSTALASDTFTSTLNVTGGSIQSVQATIYIADSLPSSRVPGPLPILGASAAFGFSRKIRTRIRFLG